MATPQTARVWNYWLGGTDNFPADRALGDRIAREFPIIVDIARADRAALARAVRHLAAEAGLRQFLDVGAGLPTADNTHEVAQAVAPECRIVYADNDPHVQAHARELLRSTRAGATDFIRADLRSPDLILRGAARTLDLTAPVAVILSGVLAHLPTAAEARDAVRSLMAALPSGSHLVIIDGTDTDPALNDVMRIWNESADPPYAMRSPAEFRSYFDDLVLVPPGVVDVGEWGAASSTARFHNLIGVAYKR